MKRLVPPVLFLLCLGLMLLTRWLWPLAILVRFPYTLLGILPIAAGLLIGFLALHQFHKARTNFLPFVEAGRLVTDGIYRHTRNPMYLGLLLVLIGSAILLGHLSSLLGILIFATVADRWYIRFEERMLHRQFGQSFDAYRARTRRWI